MDNIIITHELLQEGVSANGAWNNKQLRALGVKTPLRSGWRRELIGKSVPVKDYRKFLALKDVHLKKRKKYKNSILVDRLLEFITNNFTLDGEFNCCGTNCGGFCEHCEIKRQVEQILNLTNK